MTGIIMILMLTLVLFCIYMMGVYDGRGQAMREAVSMIEQALREKEAEKTGGDEGENED